MTHIYSWQNKQRQMIWNSISANYIPSAILLSGERGIGLTDFAIYIAKIVSCSKVKNSSPCDDCRECNSFNSGINHDLLLLGGDDEPISILDVREMINKIYYTPTSGNYRFVVIDCIEQLNSSSMNALLKTLEEPSKHVIFILISYHRTLMPATIKSRVKEIYFPTPPPSEVKKFLMERGLTENIVNIYSYIAKYRPLEAIELYKDKKMEKFEQFIEMFLSAVVNNRQLLKSSDIKSYDTLEWLDFLELILSDIVRLHMHILDSASRNKKYFDTISKLKSILNIEKILVSLGRISELYFTNKILNIKSNKQIMIDDITIRLLYKTN